MPAIHRISFGYLRIFIAFSCFTQNQGVTSENRTRGAAADRDVTDGELFLKRIVNGEKISKNPGYLMFTAPYKLCEGGCKDRNNFVMAFPLYIGKKGKSDYQSIYPRDYSTAKNKNAPFKPLQTRLPYTTCSASKSLTNPSPDPATASPDPSNQTPNEITRSTTILIWDKATLKCPKLAKCKPRNKLKGNSLFPSFDTRASPLLRSTLRPWLRSQQQDTEYYWNNYEIRPYRTVQVTTAWLALLIYANPMVAVRLPWDKWSWDVPQGPIGHFFRRHNNMPVKSPHFVCECPPNEECKLDFKLNEEAVDLLNIRGVLNQKEVQEFKDDMEMIREQTKASVLEKSVRSRRSDPKSSEEPCCCPPQTAMMPTFVAERKFNDVLDNIAFRREEEAHVKTLDPTSH